MKRLHIVTVTNDKYAKHLAVMLYSLLENKASKHPVVIYTIYGKLSDKNQFRINKALKRFNVKVKFLKINPDLYKNFKERRYLTSETYYRFSIPDLLDKDINKVLYLDSDIIVKDDVSKLWELDLSEHVMAAVEDPGHTNYLNALSIPRKPINFNAGMMLIDLKKWRRQKITQKLFKFTQKNQKVIRWPSQDPLNAVLHNNWVKLDPKWNFQLRHYKHLRIMPSIIHFSTWRKPWSCKTPFKEEYEKYAAKILWK